MRSAAKGKGKDVSSFPSNPYRTSLAPNDRRVTDPETLQAPGTRPRLPHGLAGRDAFGREIELRLRGLAAADHDLLRLDLAVHLGLEDVDERVIDAEGRRHQRAQFAGGTGRVAVDAEDRAGGQANLNVRRS